MLKISLFWIQIKLLYQRILMWFFTFNWTFLQETVVIVVRVQQQPLVHTGSIRPSKIVGRTCVSRKIFNKICPKTTRRSTYYHLRLRIYLTLYVMLPLNFKGTCNYYPVFCIQNFQIGIKLGVYFFGMFTWVLHLTLLFFPPRIWKRLRTSNNTYGKPDQVCSHR